MLAPLVPATPDPPDGAAAVDAEQGTAPSASVFRVPGRPKASDRWGLLAKESSRGGLLQKLKAMNDPLTPLMNARVKRCKMVFHILPMCFGILWLLGWWWSKATTRGGLLSLPDMLARPVLMVDLENFWILAIAGGVPFQMSIFFFSIAYECSSIANDVLLEFGNLSVEEAHPQMVQRANRFFFLDLAMLVPYASAMYIAIYFTFERNESIYLEGLPPMVSFVICYVVITCGFLYTPVLLMISRVSILRQYGSRILHYLDNQYVPAIQLVFLGACCCAMYTAFLSAGSPPYVSSLTRPSIVPGSPDDACTAAAVNASAPFDPYVTAEIACEAKKSNYVVRGKFIAAISLWLNHLGVVLFIQINAMVKSQVPKFPLAPFLAQILAGSCMCGFVPFFVAVLLVPSADINDQSWLVRVAHSWWLPMLNFGTWLTTVMLLYIEFFLRRLEALMSGTEMEVVLPTAEKRSLREVLVPIVEGRLAGAVREPSEPIVPASPTATSGGGSATTRSSGGGAATTPSGGSTSKFAGEPGDLVTGKPIDAPLGIEHFMRVRRDFAMPAASEGVEAVTREVEASGTPSDKECLHYILHERAGSSSITFANGGLKRDCLSDGTLHPLRRTASGEGMSFDDFCNDPRAATTAMLQPAHVLCLRLYTTAAFRSLNNPLRNTDPNRPPHGFPITIKYICEGIGKLRAVDAASGHDGPLDLWRGLRNLRVQDDFVKQGGTEQAPMSTTTDLSVAVRYSLGSSSLLFKLRTNTFMTRGADLTFLSAFPDEREILFPPLTFLRPTGKKLTLDFDAKGVRYTVVEVEPIF